MNPLPRVFMVIVTAALAGLGVTKGATQSLAGRTILPVDEAHKEPSFVKYRERLLNAARAGDVKAILSMTSSSARYNEDLETSLVDFKREWRIDSRPQEFLESLIDVLLHGGRFDSRGGFVAPYVYTDFPGSEQEMMTHVVVVKSEAPVFAARSQDARPIARVSYMILGLAGGPTWYSVTLPDGRKGFMRGADVRQPSDPRAYFRRVGGVWKLDLFAKGMD